MVARSGGGVSYYERRVAKEEVSRLKQVFNEMLVFLKERLSKNRE